MTKRMTKQWWAVAWGAGTGISIRIAQTATSEEAMKYCYGLVNQTMTAREYPKNPKYMSARDKKAFYDALVKAHEKVI